MWKADELVIVGVWVQLVMAMVGAGMEVVGGMHAGQSQVCCSHVGRCRRTC